MRALPTQGPLQRPQANRKIRAPRQYDEMEGAALRAFALLVGHRPHSSSANRFTARASGFLLLIQSGERPDLYRESFRLETIEAGSIAARPTAVSDRRCD